MSTITKLRIKNVEEASAERPIASNDAYEQKRAYIADATILLSRMNSMREEACRLHSRLRMGTDHYRALDYLMAACADFENALEDGLANANDELTDSSHLIAIRG